LDVILSELLFGLASVAVLLPWIIAVRITVSVAFDLYSVRLGRLRVVDISRLFIVYVIPSIIFVLLRFFSSLEVLRLPLSIIFLEYVLSVFGSIVIRLAYIDVQYRIVSKHSPHIRHIVLYGDVNEVSDDLIPRLERSMVIHGILSPNPMQWEQSHQGYTVLGDSPALFGAMKYDNTISDIVIFGDADLTEKRFNRLRDIAKSLSLNIYRLTADGMRSEYLSLPADFEKS
jgi:FlaA1/EpsC-like NDP-sugar epimerase